MNDMTGRWPANKIFKRPVKALVPYARNARTHSPEQIDQIAKAIGKWGWTNPILIDEDNGIIAGHGRVLAAHQLGIKNAPVMVATGWTEDMKRAFVIADNQIATNAGWDPSMFAAEVAELSMTDFDITLIGFDPNELKSMSDFRPELAPDAGARTITGDDIDRAGAGLEQRFQDASKQNLVTVMCPHCDEQFTINKDAL